MGLLLLLIQAVVVEVLEAVLLLYLEAQADQVS
jgi:hypothetical protein